MNQPLLRTEADYNKFLHCLQKQKEHYHLHIIGYALFKNVVHILMENTTKYALSAVIHSLTMQYTKYYQHKYNYTGLIFGIGYPNKLIKTDRELLCHLRYIHQKPKVKGLSSNFKYPYSSYNDYMNPQAESFLSRYTIYRLFDLHNETKACNLLRCIHHEMEERLDFDISPDLDEKVSIAKKIIREEMEKYKVNYESIPKNYDFREQLIMKIHQESQLTQTEISDLLGLSRHIVGRVIRLHHHR